MLNDLYSKLEGTTISPGTQNIAAAIQKEAGFPVPDEVALVAALALTVEIHLNLSPVCPLEKLSKDIADTHDQVTSGFLCALQVVGVSHGLTTKQLEHVAHVAERASIADFEAHSKAFDALHAIPQTSLQ